MISIPVMQNIRQLRKSNPSFKVSKIFLVFAFMIFLSCADYFYYELYSAFYPETSKRPPTTERFFFTNYYPYNVPSYAYDTNEGNDSINIDSWVKYTANKIPRTMFFDGLMRNSKQLQTSLAQKGFKEAAKYVETLLATDKLILNQFGDDPWDGPLPKDTALIKSLYPAMEQNIINCKDLFLKERYIYLLLKTTSSIADHKQTILYYEKHGAAFKPTTFISDWSWCKYAGAFYHVGDHARSFYEFSKIFNQSESKRAEAGHSVMVYSIPYSEVVLEYCKNDDEKANVYALAAILPHGNGLGMMEKIYAYKPEHDMLQLIATREINKNEELYYQVKLEDDEYSSSSNSLKKTNIPELLAFFNKVITDKKTDSLDFWYLAAAYLYSLSDDVEKGKKYLQEVKEDSSNPYIGKQKKLLNIIFELQSRTPYDDTSFAKIYHDISSFQRMEKTRDMSTMKLIGNTLADYFQNRGNAVMVNKPTSFFSGCGKKKIENVDKVTHDSARVFFAQLLSKISGTYEEDGISYISGGFERQPFLDTLTTNLLSNVVSFIEKKDPNPLDTMLIHLANISYNELYLAYGRRLMLDHRFEDALQVYRKITPDFMKNLVNQVHFNQGPELYLKSWKYEKITNYLTYIESIVSYKKATETNPKDSEAWYKLGEAMMNISYHGKAWILSKSMWSSAEMDYYWWGHDEYFSKPNQADNQNYYSNLSSISCFENAAQYCTDKNLGAKISYLGAMAERNKFWAQYYKNQPNDYEKRDAYHQTQMGIFNSKFISFFKLLKSKFNNSEYEKMILKECETYSDFVQ